MPHCCASAPQVRRARFASTRCDKVMNAMCRECVVSYAREQCAFTPSLAARHFACMAREPTCFVIHSLCSASAHTHAQTFTLRASRPHQTRALQAFVDGRLFRSRATLRSMRFIHSNQRPPMMMMMMIATLHTHSHAHTTLTNTATQSHVCARTYTFVYVHES